MEKRGSIGLMIVLIFIGLFVSVIGGLFLIDEMDLRKNGVDAEGFIVDWEESYTTVEDSMGHQHWETSYYPVFSFKLESGEIRKTANVGMDYETYRQHDIGDVMMVRWSADTDYLSWSNSITGIIIPSITLGVGILCVILGIIFCRPRLAKPNESLR